MKLDPVYVILAGIFILLLGGMLSAHGQTANSTFIPAWVKGIAGWWAEGKITDSDFQQAIQFLVDTNIIKIHNATTVISSLKATVPQNTTLQFGVSNSTQTQLQFGFSNATQIKFGSSNQTTTLTYSAQLQAPMTTLDLMSTSKNWSGGTISDNEFITQIQSMIDSGQLSNDVPKGSMPLNESGQQIPPMLKDQAKYYAEGNLPEQQWKSQILGALFRLGLIHNP